MREWLEEFVPAGQWHDALLALLGVGPKVLLVLAIFLAARWTASRAIGILFRPLVARAGQDGGTNPSRARTLESLARSTASYTILFICLVALLEQVGFNITTILAGAGVAGLAISFGAQKLVRDVLSGLFLLLEDEYRVGETVTLAGVPGMPQLSGCVVELGLRVTRLEDGVGRRVTVCNGDVAAVMNHSRGLLLTAVELGVPAEASEPELQAALAGADLPSDLFFGPAEAAGVVSTDGTRQVVRITARSRPNATGEAELVLRRAAAEALQKAGIGLR